MPGNVPSGTEDVDLIEREGYLEARLKGAFALERFKRQIAFMLQSCKDRGFNRLLTDVTAFTNVESMSTLDRFEIGSQAASLGKKLLSLALVGSSNQFDPERFGVQVARNRGMNVQVFTDPKAAVTWLLAPEAMPGG